MSWKDDLLEKAVKQEEERKKASAQLDENNGKMRKRVGLAVVSLGLIKGD